MPSKNIIAVIIICSSIVFSTWFLSRNMTKIVPVETNSAISISDNTPKPEGWDDWKNILVGVNQETTTILTSQNTATVYSGEGTITDQMAKDFFAQYLILKQGGNEVTAEQTSKIVENTLSSPEYTKTTGVQYTANNIHIIQQTDKQTAQNYLGDINQSLKTNSPKNTESELVILDKAVKSGKESDLAKLDPIIAGYRGIIVDLISINVPSDAVNLHLNFLNTISNITANIEAMRQTFSDPVRSFAGVSQYKIHALDLVTSMEKLDQYFLSKK